MQNQEKPASRIDKNVDRAIGRKIKETRLLAGLSQTQLGAKLGVTFQQVQKYENGVNRVSTKSLILIASVLKCGVMHLISEVIEDDVPGVLNDPIGKLGQTRQGAEVARLWGKIGDWEKRNLLVRLMRTIADEPLQRESVTLSRPDRAPPNAAGTASRPPAP